MRINTNISAMNTYSRLGAANAAKSGSLAKLSSGLRINKAGDDAAGLAISEKMKNQISGLNQATRNAQDGISLIQTAEGAMKETHSILNRMRDLTVQAGNDTNTSDDRKAIQSEIKELTDEIDRIAETTKFNGKPLMNAGTAAGDAKVTSETLTGVDSVTMKAAFTTATGGTVGTAAGDLEKALNSLSDEALKDVVDAYNIEAAKDDASGDTIKSTTLEDIKVANKPTGTSFSFQIGANDGETIDLTINNMSKDGLGISDVKVDYTDVEVKAGKTAESDVFGAQLKVIDNAIAKVSEERAKLGATQNRLDHTVSNLATTKENLSEANSRIVDVDMAEEMMSFTKSNILSQAATSMLAQANQMPQGVLQLLQ